MIYHWQRKKVYLLINTVLKELHGIHEAAFFHGDDQINRIEVFFAVKASCQIGLMIGGCMKVVAQIAEHTKKIY
jgi:hypothetical protein